jgi:hypothetical protein
VTSSTEFSIYADRAADRKTGYNLYQAGGNREIELNQMAFLKVHRCNKTGSIVTLHVEGFTV